MDGKVQAGGRNDVYPKQKLYNCQLKREIVNIRAEVKFEVSLYWKWKQLRMKSIIKANVPENTAVTANGG